MWRADAARDLAAMHQALLANSPAPFSGPSGKVFRHWLDKGFAQARWEIPQVRDSSSYYYLLRGYAGGFRDSHVAVYPVSDEPLARPRAWPGFALAWSNGAYRVSWRGDQPSAAAPPVGARLISCGGLDADALAQRRLDRFDGNLELAFGRFRTASRLLVDEGNPFVPPPPKTCSFQVDGHTRSFTLRYVAPTDAEVRDHLTQMPRSDDPFTLERVSKDAWWLRIPLMQGDGWAHLLSEVDKHREELRAAPLVVMDLRGNYGGDSAYAERLAARLWGSDLVASRQPPEGDVIWRVSAANLAFLRRCVDQYSKDPEGAADLAYYTDLLHRMDRAIAARQATFTIHEAPLPVTRPAPSPMHGQVVLFTDYWCNSACLDLMDLFLRMPRTVQAGTETNADTIFMEETELKLPSGRTEFSFGHKAIIGRMRRSNETYRPSPARTYTGDLDDDSVRRWVLGKFARSGF